MSKLYPSQQIIKALLRCGFREVSPCGSHKKFFNGTRVVIVPADKKEIPMGTFLSILRQSGLTKADLD